VTSLGLPEYVASPVVALLLVFAFARLARELVGPSAALVGTVLLACCPFFVFNGASYFSHMPAALFGVLFVLCGVRFLKSASVPMALAAGAALGFLGIIRPYSAVLVAIPAAGELLRRASSQHYRRLAWFFVGALPFIAGFLFYNDATTGNPLLPTEAWALPNIHMGLQPVDEYGVRYTLLDTSMSAIIRFMELAQWTSPLFCFLYAVAALWKLSQRSLEFYDFVFPVFVLGFLLFFGLGGNRYGPRYYFEAYPFMVLTVISAATAWLPARPAASRQATATAAVIGAMIMGLVSYPALAYQLRKVVNERMDVYDVVAEAHLSNAIVAIRSETGTVRRMAPGELTQNGLTRDGIDLSQGVLYGLDQPTQYCALTRAFPGRTLYRYERKNEIGPGMLVALRIDRC
jgi:4-amino-4-deoxy-L-arabinose transferase-like glycosyltransferase